MIDKAQQTDARTAGATYLAAFACVAYANFGIHDRLNVAGDAVATAQKILANEPLFRAGIVFDLAYCIGTLTLAAALYVVFRPVNRGVAMLAAFLRVVWAIAWLIMTFKLLDALRLLHAAESLRVFAPAQLQALAKVYLSSRFDLYYGGLPFFALAATLCAYLLFRSNYMPRALSAAGVAACGWCVVCAFAFLLFPGFSRVVNLWWFDTPMALFEITWSVWFLTRGLQERAEVQHA